MGKRKPRRKAPPKAAPPKLEMEFDCPFCCAIKSVQVFMKRKEGLASLSCRTCNVDYETQVSPLDEAVDVFSSWIDNCEEVNSPVSSGPANLGPSGGLSLSEGVLPIPPRSLPLRSPMAPSNNKRRRIESNNGRLGRRRPSTDADLEAEEAAEAAQEAEETYSAHDDDEEEPILDEEEELEDESIGNVEDVNESGGGGGGGGSSSSSKQRQSRGRLQKKAAWGSDDED